MADTVEKFCAKRFAREKILFSPTSSFPDDTIDKAEETAGTRRSSAFRRRTAGGMVHGRMRRRIAAAECKYIFIANNRSNYISKENKTMQ